MTVARVLARRRSPEREREKKKKPTLGGYRRARLGEACSLDGGGKEVERFRGPSGVVLVVGPRRGTGAIAVAGARCCRRA